MEHQCLLCGPIIEDEPTYWNVDLGWVNKEDEASRLPMEIMNLPLPRGTSAILEETYYGQVIAFHPVPPMGEGVYFCA